MNVIFSKRFVSCVLFLYVLVTLFLFFFILFLFLLLSCLGMLQNMKQGESKHVNSAHKAVNVLENSTSL